MTPDRANVPAAPRPEPREHFRILVVLAYPGYLRYFDSLLRELAARGHELELWFDNDEKQPEGLEAVAGVDGIELGGLTPSREDDTHRRARLLRLFGDFIRYVDPRFADATYLRRRAAGNLPFVLRPLSRIRTLPRPIATRLVRLSLALEQAVPRSPRIDRFLRERSVDALVISPAVLFAGRQADLFASARAVGVPTVAAIASWDHLTTKGLLRGRPERVLVWNEAQALEAEHLHFIERDRIAVTGAQPFDRWFGREPGRTDAEFADRVGLPPGQRYVLFVGSTASISAPQAEQEFVRTWIRALRASGKPALRELGVLVRPHPYNSLHWDDVDLSELGAVAIWPRDGANPVNEHDRTDYFDSIYHSSAVIGINTSAMVEAAIIGRPVLTLTPREFTETQTGTLHFHHLLPENGGFLRRADSLDQHVAQLAEVLHSRDEVSQELTAFVGSFVRPHGLDRPATQIFANVVEDVARAGVQPAAPRVSWARPILRVFDLLAAIDELFLPELVAKRLRNRGQADHRRLVRLGRFLMNEAAALSRRRPTIRRLRLVKRARGTHKRLKRVGGWWESKLTSAADRVDLRVPDKRSRGRETFGRAHPQRQRRDGRETQGKRGS